jgi:hypothetical protein
MKGWVYVISNKAMQSLVKVGFSTKDPDLRADELNHTGSPHPYLVEYEVLIEEPYEIEQATHKLLSSKHEAKEWYRCSAEEAVAAIKQVSGLRIITETYKRAEREKAEALHRRKLEEQEVRRRQEQAEKDLEDRLRNEEAIIRENFDKQVAVSFPPRPFWNYWLGGGFLVIVSLAVFFPKISDSGGLMAAAFLGALIGWGFQEYWESKRKQSGAYRALEKERDEKLTAARTRVETQRSKMKSPQVDSDLLRELQPQAESGDVRSQFKLFEILYYGKGVARNVPMAVEWLRKAAANGDPSVQHVLGKMYSAGEGLPRDDAKAAVWYERAAEQGYAPAQTELGRMYLLGQGVPQSYGHALMWFRKAATQGDAHANYNLGVMSLEGHGLPKDKAEAITYLSKAAKLAESESPSIVSACREKLEKLSCSQ